MSPHFDPPKAFVCLRQYPGIHLTNRRSVQSRLCLHVPGQRGGAVQKLLLVVTLLEAQLGRCCRSQAQLIQGSHCFVFPVRSALPEPGVEAGGSPWTGSCGAQAPAFAPSAFPDQKTSASTLRLPLVRDIEMNNRVND